MKGSQIFCCALILTVATACKTQEDVRRERTVENLNEEIQQTKKSTATGNSRFMAIEDQVAQLNGRLEEMNYNKSQATKELQTLHERISKLEDTNTKQVEYIKALTEKVNNQSDYIAEVIESLAKLSTEKSESKPASKKKNINEDVATSAEDLPATFENALKKYKANQLMDAKEIFQKIFENKSAKKKDKEGATHFLGMIEYKNKKYESAKVYFSKLFSENPDSSFAPATLLNLSKTFTQLKSQEEANMTLDELISRFPKSKEAVEASKLKR